MGTRGRYGLACSMIQTPRARHRVRSRTEAWGLSFILSIPAESLFHRTVAILAAACFIYWLGRSVEFQSGTPWNVVRDCPGESSSALSDFSVNRFHLSRQSLCVYIYIYIYIYIYLSLGRISGEFDQKFQVHEFVRLGETVGEKEREEVGFKMRVYVCGLYATSSRNIIALLNYCNIKCDLNHKKNS